MSDFLPEDHRSPEEKEDGILYWQSKPLAERLTETCRLSMEKYGTPKGNFRDGPCRKIRRNPDGTETVLSEWCGPNPLQPSLEHSLKRFWDLIKASSNLPPKQESK
jgi:hypothetical protein